MLSKTDALDNVQRVWISMGGFLGKFCREQGDQWNEEILQSFMGSIAIFL